MFYSLGCELVSKDAWRTHSMWAMHMVWVSGHGSRVMGHGSWVIGQGIMGDIEKGEHGGSQEGELRYGGVRMRLRGRALRLILWLAAHQTRINETAPESGQIWLTWKGEGPQSIDGDIRTRL